MISGRLPLVQTLPSDGDPKIVAAAAVAPTGKPICYRTATVTADFARLREDLERELDRVLGGGYLRATGRLPR